MEIRYLLQPLRHTIFGGPILRHVVVLLAGHRTAQPSTAKVVPAGHEGDALGRPVLPRRLAALAAGLAQALLACCVVRARDSRGGRMGCPAASRGLDPWGAVTGVRGRWWRQLTMRVVG